MYYLSTRNNKLRIRTMDAIKQGISQEGGLFVPETIPKLANRDFLEMADMDYRSRAFKVLSPFLTDYNPGDLKKIIDAAYGKDNFDCPDIAPVIKLDNNLFIQELWHGPTYAFKDMALQILPHLMTYAVSNTDEDKEIVILVATSGDTGKAALEGFRDVNGTQIIVFYPDEGVSTIQKLQMVTQQGENVHVAAVKGNFDDTQTGVKAIFTDDSYNKLLEERGKRFSSANSINWGRLVPQIVYYVSAYTDLLKNNDLAPGEKFNVVVPTGNFGNILAAYYAKNMGVPIDKLICASNRNNILTDFIKTGIYDTRRDFYKTISPSMDILISSNLERLLFELCGRQDRQIRMWMRELNETGRYKLDEESLNMLQSILWGGSADEEQTLKAIWDTYRQYKYIIDPHTAVGKWVYDEYREETGDTQKTILVSTASPFKFPGDVLKAIKDMEYIQGKDDFQVLEALASASGMKIPPGLMDLKYKPILHQTTLDAGNMRQVISNFLELDG
ncbi:MAG: threonine synthase [Caldicoprobacterales bacterium]|nr:threonine synthase [Clostridiales bacterium]